MKYWPDLKPYMGLLYKNKQSKEEDKDV